MMELKPVTSAYKWVHIEYEIIDFLNVCYYISIFYNWYFKVLLAKESIIYI